jgi:hypothetical protein
VTAYETDFCRALWQVYLMRGGARDRLLQVVGYTKTGRQLASAQWQVESPYLFPTCVGAGMPGGMRSREERLALAVKQQAQLCGETLSRGLAASVRKHATALRVDLEALEGIFGAMRFHTIRRLYGTLHAPTNLVRTSRRLDHSDVQFTLDVYVAEDEAAQTMASGYGTSHR